MSGGRYLIAVAVDDPGAGSRLQPLSGVREDLSLMHALFVDRLGYKPVVLTPDGVSASSPANLNVSAETIRAGLLRWRKQTRAEVPRSVVFYFSGHAIARGDDLHLCTQGFEDAVPASGLDVRGIVQSLDRASPQLWIILDVCYAGAGAKALAHEAAQAMAGAGTALWFLASSGGRVPSHDGVFSRAFVNAARSRPRTHEALAASLTEELTRIGARQRVQQISAGQAAFDLLQNDAGTLGALSRLQIAPRLHPRLAQAALVLSVLWLVTVLILLRMQSSSGAMALTTSASAAVSNLAVTEQPQEPVPTPAQRPQPTAVSSLPPAAAAVRALVRDKAPEPTGMRVRVLAEPIGRGVVVTAAQPLRGRDLFGVYVTLDAAAYVGVIHVGVDGRLTLVYPQTRELRVPAGVLTRIPPNGEGNLEVDAEPGVDHFLVVALHEPIRAQTPAGVAELLRRAVGSHGQWLHPSARHAAATAPVQVRARYWRDDSAAPGSEALLGAALLEIHHVAHDAASGF